MKNFIYVSVVAVVFFCSCKSNSFMNQRYTHFDHSVKKSGLQKNSPERMERKTYASLHEQKTLTQEEPTTGAKIQAEEMKDSKAENVQMKANSVFVSNKAKTSTTGFHAAKKVKALGGMVKETSKRAIKSMKEQNTNAWKHGLVFGIINLALFIVICVVVVVGVIFLLGVLF